MVGHPLHILHWFAITCCVLFLTSSWPQKKKPLLRILGASFFFFFKFLNCWTVTILSWIFFFLCFRNGDNKRPLPSHDYKYTNNNKELSLASDRMHWVRSSIFSITKKKIYALFSTVQCACQGLKSANQAFLACTSLFSKYLFPSAFPFVLIRLCILFSLFEDCILHFQF